MRNSIKRYLLNLGFSPSLKGFDYIVEAILIYKENPKMNLGEIYVEIAEKLNVPKWSRIERAIRHSIERTFDNSPKMQKEFENYSYNLGKVPNYNFIAYSVTNLQLKGLL